MTKLVGLWHLLGWRRLTLPGYIFMFDLNSVLDSYTLVDDFQGLLSIGSVFNKRDFTFNIASDFRNADLVIMDLLI